MSQSGFYIHFLGACLCLIAGYGWFVFYITSSALRREQSITLWNPSFSKHSVWTGVTSCYLSQVTLSYPSFTYSLCLLKLQICGQQTYSYFHLFFKWPFALCLSKILLCSCLRDRKGAGVLFDPHSASKQFISPKAFKTHSSSEATPSCYATHLLVLSSMDFIHVAPHLLKTLLTPYISSTPTAFNIPSDFSNHMMSHQKPWFTSSSISPPYSSLPL